MVSIIAAVLGKVKAFWQPIIQGLLSMWRYVVAILSTLVPVSPFISVSHEQHGTSIRQKEQIPLITTAHNALPESQYVSTPKQNHWCRTAGRVLDVFMREANYSRHARSRITSFFAESIVPFLGPSTGPGFKRWKSFMTDDHTPIELSWDWRGLTDKPIIRLSVEPVGLTAGTFADPVNSKGPDAFKHMLTETFPKLEMSWFDHFNSFFNRRTMEVNPVEGHRSRIFWGFDLSETQITSKAYFFPGPFAREIGTTNLGAITESLAYAPYCTPGNLQAFHKLVSFAASYDTDALEFDMLAIDMVDPMKSRLKLYFRNRQTAFSSVRSTITLKGQKPGAHLEKGLKDLKQLWDLLFHLPGASEDAELPFKEHRTAGILYNVEFRLGNSYPDVKIYIPVRHYSNSDEDVLGKIGEFVDNQRQAVHPSSGNAPEMMGSAYVRAMKSIL
ncbi:aromatic prenyltransferase [Hypoxylon sp. NC0597]|nr:aromatic prenyltransferase [Hypoxylon sp. NC0597]